MMEVGVASLGVIPIVVMGLLVLGGIVLTVILLSFQKTRVAGVVLLMIGMLFVVGVGALAWKLQRAGYENHRRHASAVAELHYSTSRMLELEKTARDNETIVSRPQEVPATEDVSKEESGNVLLAMGRALGNGLVGTGEEEAIDDSPSVDEDSTEHAVAEIAKTEPPAAPDKDDLPPRPELPDWVGASPQRTPDGYQMSVTVGPYATRRECDEALPAALQVATADYVKTCLGSEAARRVRLSMSYIQDQIVKQTWEETVRVTLAPNQIVLDADETSPMVQFHVLLEFGPRVKVEVEKQWQQAIVTGRLWYTGTAATAVLLLLAVLFAGLKIDQATGGGYRKRLGFVAVLAALVIIAAARHATTTNAIDRSPVDHTATSVVTSGEQVKTVAGHGTTTTIVMKDNLAAKVVLLLIGLFLLVGIVALIAFKRTRTVGLVILALVIIGSFVSIS